MVCCSSIVQRKKRTSFEQKIKLKNLSRKFCFMDFLSEAMSFTLNDFLSKICSSYYILYPRSSFCKRTNYHVLVSVYRLSIRKKKKKMYIMRRRTTTRRRSVLFSLRNRCIGAYRADVQIPTVNVMIKYRIITCTPK